MEQEATSPETSKSDVYLVAVPLFDKHFVLQEIYTQSRYKSFSNEGKHWCSKFICFQVNSIFNLHLKETGEGQEQVENTNGLA